MSCTTTWGLRCRPGLYTVEIEPGVSRLYPSPRSRDLGQTRASDAPDTPLTAGLQGTGPPSDTLLPPSQHSFYFSHPKQSRCYKYWANQLIPCSNLKKINFHTSQLYKISSGKIKNPHRRNLVWVSIGFPKTWTSGIKLPNLNIFKIYSDKSKPILKHCSLYYL